MAVYTIGTLLLISCMSDLNDSTVGSKLSKLKQILSSIVKHQNVLYNYCNSLHMPQFWECYLGWSVGRPGKQ